MTGTEYLELIEAAGVDPSTYPQCQAVHQHLLWKQVESLTANGKSLTSELVETAIKDLKANNHQFHMDGASWTNNISWVRGYDNILQPMMQLSAKFHEKYDAATLEKGSNLSLDSKEYHEALLYNLLLQTSCFRYWGQGMWTDFAQELYKRGLAAVGSTE